jgi:hypothetical protein
MENKFLEIIIQKYTTDGYEPQLIPHQAINHLRGCTWCIDLKNTCIDTVAILAKKDIQERSDKILYMFEYALRGNIRGIPSGRVILQSESKWKGIIRKKLLTVKWVIPNETSPTYIQRRAHNPKPGEIYNAGPFMTLTRSLNDDEPHITLLKELCQRLGSNSRLIIYSDNWNEAIRLASNDWIPEDRVHRLYTSQLYLEVAKNIFTHLQSLRKQFGGLTF